MRRAQRVRSSTERELVAATAATLSGSAAQSSAVLEGTAEKQPIEV